MDTTDTNRGHVAETEHEHDLEGLDAKFFAHAQMPCHLGRLPRWDGRALGVGVCGDSIEVFIEVADRQLAHIRYFPKGCVYTVACGSAMSKLVQGCRLEDALKIQPEDVADELGGLPADHMHCANLAVNTLGEALDDYYRKVWARPRPGDGKGRE